MPADAAVLDGPEVYGLDSQGMFGHISTVGEQLLSAWQASARVPMAVSLSELTGVVIAGIGGSATAGDYFAACAAPVSPIPVVVAQGYELPGWVGSSTLVAVCSYSGNTPETLAAYAAARARSAPIVAITGGGALAARAAADGMPVFPIEYRASPRATTVHTLAPLLRIGTNLGLVNTGDLEISAVSRSHRELVATELDPAVESSSNAAKQIAADIAGRTAIILGSGHLEPTAVRFKNQLAENGKTIAAADFIPQAGHNLVVGLAAASSHPDDYVAIVPGSRLLLREVAERAMAVSQEFESAGIRVHGILLEGGTMLGDILLATAWGDYVSCYVALLTGHDPTPIPQIERIRAYGS